MNSGKHIVVVCPNPAIDILASFEKFEIGVPNRLIKEERYPGGKGIHVAMALAEFGLDVVVIGFWGSVTGQWIKSECNRYYPTIRFNGPELAEWSRSCYTFKSGDAFDDTEVLGTGPTITPEDLRALLKTIERYLPSAEAVALSGSWPKGTPEDAAKQVIETANSKSVKTYLDCTGIQLRHGLSSDPFCVHLNRRELTEYFKMDFGEARNEILRSCEVAAITDGAKGLYLSNKATTNHSLCKIENVISTIGSGDCLLAGIIAGFSMNLPFEQIAKMGAAFGAANCLRPELGMLHKIDVDHLMEALT